MSTRFVTEETLREALGDTVDVDSLIAEELGAILEDAEGIYALVVAEPWLTEAALRTKAEGEGFDPDRVNAALKVLAAAGRIFAVNLTEKQIPVLEDESAQES